MLEGMLFMADASPIDLSVKGFDPVPTTPGHGKSPVQVPEILQDGYELTFQSSHAAYTLNVLDEGGVVYSVSIAEDATSVTLPSWLSGTFEIQLVPEDSSYYFYGIINL